MTSIRKNALSGQRVIQLFQFAVIAMVISVFSTAAMAEKVNLNQAGAEALQYIPGIGPGKSADIIKHREQNGDFKSYEDLLDVPGIGEKTLIDVRKYGALEGGVSELTEEMQANPPEKTVSAATDTQGQTSG